MLSCWTALHRSLKRLLPASWICKANMGKSTTQQTTCTWFLTPVFAPNQRTNPEQPALSVIITPHQSYQNLTRPPLQPRVPQTPQGTYHILQTPTGCRFEAQTHKQLPMSITNNIRVNETGPRRGIRQYHFAHTSHPRPALICMAITRVAGLGAAVLADDVEKDDKGDER